MEKPSISLGLAMDHWPHLSHQSILVLFIPQPLCKKKLYLVTEDYSPALHDIHHLWVDRHMYLLDIIMTCSTAIYLHCP